MINTKAFDTCCSLLSSDLRQALFGYNDAEEIRLRLGYKPSIISAGREIEIADFSVTEKHLLHTIEIASGASFHSSETFISSGYLSYKGLRIGLCGQAIYKNGGIIGFRRYSSLSIRIPHQIKNIIGDHLLNQILYPPANTLVVSAPGLGKTTALREIVHYISQHGYRVGLVDERGEMAGENNCFDLGRCTDIFSFVPKAISSIIMLRSMNPQFIAMDEITKPEDIQAIYDIVGCGVNVIASAHGSKLADMMHRPLYKKLIDEAVFENFLFISMDNDSRKYTLERMKQ